MTIPHGPVLAAALALALGGCGAGDPAARYAWRLPPGFPVPPVPADNPMSEAKVELGRRLFYDKRLSVNETQACATCHVQALAFTDGKGRAVGATGEVHTRGALSLANAAWRATYNWENSLLRTLEQQALVPLFNMDPAVELGMDGKEALLLERLAAPARPATSPSTTRGSTTSTAWAAIRSTIRG